MAGHDFYTRAGTFLLYIRTDNDAFADDAGSEVARILRETADRIDAGTTFGTFTTLRDVNGNDVGRAKLFPAEC